MLDSSDNSRTTGSTDSALDALLGVSTDSFYQRFHARRTLARRLLFLLLALLCGTFILYVTLWRAPTKFPSGTIVQVKRGTPLGEVATLLFEKGAIRSPFWFKVWTTLLSGKAGLKAGDYYLSEPTSVIFLANRFADGKEGLQAVRITIPEGLSNREVSSLLSKGLLGFDSARFLQLAKGEEGYLFPDTYRFSPNADESLIITEMTENFEKKISSLEYEIASFGKPLREVMIMASLVEGEARTMETRRLVAGILWKRLKLGMPLQVDAVFPYIIGKNTYEVTTEDLRIDSPYNTYRNVGLPPGPINNPSLDAVRATVTPLESKYLYYLTDDEGVMRYAATHAEHLRNRAKYLGK